jgi:hypothetical protein
MCPEIPGYEPPVDKFPQWWVTASLAVDAKKFTEHWNATRYHAPSDNMNQPLNFDAAVQFMQIDFLVRL